ncbi:hypothetical protein ABZX62_13145 [Streptomyces flavidovirens]|uniref:hypothetical protein n=1 Tax=Streptomyces flavidovirens TaxID=67298 RepID=UPI0033A7AFB0
MTDTWNGEPLADAKSVNEDIHYRIHDVDTGALLVFGTGRGGALGAVVAHCRRVEDAHPGRRLVIRAYDAVRRGRASTAPPDRNTSCVHRPPPECGYRVQPPRLGRRRSGAAVQVAMRRW